MRTQAIAVLAAAGLFLLGGCGGSDEGNQVATAGDSDATATSEPNGAQAVVDEEDRRRQFTQCMREHGVDLPDPDPNADRRLRIEARDGIDKEEARAALEACREFLPNGGERRELSPEDLEKLRQFAQCLRDHGLDVQDPDPNGGGIFIPKDDDGKPANDEQLQQAMEACRDLNPKARDDK